MKKQLYLLLGAFLICFNINSQSKNITIKVKDKKNKPVAGAIILFDNVKQKRLTNKKGVFKVKTEANPKEVAAFHPNLGIRKVKYNGNNTISINIIESNDSYSESNSTKSKNKTATTMQFQNIYDYIRGKVPGVTIGGNNTITIRGYNSINGSTSPLFILNDNQVDQSVISDIVPTTIKSIIVLKGPETATYGIRGANGVIVVETL